MAYELLSESRKLSKRGGPNKSEEGLENFLKKNKREEGTFIRNPRVRKGFRKTHPQCMLFKNLKFTLKFNENETTIS